MRQPRRVALAGTLIVLAAVAGALALREDAPSVPAAGALEPAREDLGAQLQSTQRRVFDLAEALERAHAERTELAGEVASLREELARLSEPADATVTRTATPRSRREHRRRDADRAAEPEAGPRPFDPAALVAAGFAEDTVRTFKESVDQIELDRLYLRDLAAREGWLNTPRFREESRALASDLRSTREEYGEEFYDWMLYTTGHPNRVQVGEVMSNSAAAEAGLQPGDTILRYDDERVFAPGELRNATTGGTAGDPTPIDIVRNGRQMRVLVPRGPLGIRISPVVQAPNAAS